MPRQLIKRAGCRCAIMLILPLISWLASDLASAASAEAEHPPISFPAHVVLDIEQMSISIDTIADSWAIELQNKKLLGSVAAAQRTLYEIPRLFSGTVIGKPGSWVRLSYLQSSHGQNSGLNQNPALHGHLFVDGALFELKQNRDGASYEVLQLSDSELYLDEKHTNIDRQSAQRSARSIQTIDAPAPKAIRIGIAIDSKYDDYYNHRGLANALAVINSVDGLFQDQLGLALIVENVRVYSTPDDAPLHDYPGNLTQLLDYFVHLRSNEPELPSELALVHLFSGHKDSHNKLGQGWYDTVCRLDGYDLSVSTPYPNSILLVAHEIAHNLGALHDDEAQCENDVSVSGTEIMWPEISGNTRLIFSACSLLSMQQSLKAACVLDDIDVSIALSNSPAVSTENQRIDLSVTNADQYRSAQQLISTTVFPENTQLSQASAGCVISQSTMVCLHDVPPSSQTRTSVTANFDPASTSIISSKLTTGEFVDTHPLDNQTAIDLQIARSNDLSISYPARADTPVDEQATYDVSAATYSSSARLSGGMLSYLHLLSLFMLALLKHFTFRFN